MKYLKLFFSKTNVIIYLIIFGLVSLDLISKYLIESSLNLGESIVILNGILNFTFILNKGAAWGIFSDANATILLGILSLVFAILMLIINAFVIKQKNILYYFSFALILGGTIGNMIDRLVFSAVRDFIHVDFINFPIFNLADIFLVVGVGLFCVWYLISVFKEEKRKEKDIN